MNKVHKILIENELYRLITTLYDSYKDKAQDEIKVAIKRFANENELSEVEVLDKLNTLTKNRNSNFESIDLTKWYDEKE